jgi:hypothetical protein
MVMKKLPLWVWNNQSKKWEIVPYDLFDTFLDGKKGFDFHKVHENALVGQFIKNHRDHFEWEVSADRYVLLTRKQGKLEQKLRDTGRTIRNMRWADYGICFCLTSGVINVGWAIYILSGLFYHLLKGH